MAAKKVAYSGKVMVVWWDYSMAYNWVGASASMMVAPSAVSMADLKDIRMAA